jgi:hypothetical protein
MERRNPVIRRSGLADRRFETEEMHYAAVIAECGGIFRGIQKGIPGVIDALVLFDASIMTPLGRPTLSLPHHLFCLEAVKARLVESAEKFKTKSGGAS